ncbi:MAG TPA: hypothetical protein VM934_01380 [Pyrinomonadaceae bacterium]|jgi:type II secretory pathway component GspD/PulD (secretin)|nr:hypothetical protein [Pyrinomonadaceae bacterium]
MAVGMKQYRSGDWRRGLIVTAFALGLLSSAPSTLAVSQKSDAPAKQAAASGASKPAKTWSVRISKSAPRTVSIKAKDAKLTDVAAEIARILKVPVKLSPLMEKQLVTLSFNDLTFETALRQLAPQPYVDYEAGGEDQYQPKVLAIYLHALNERPPSLTEAVKGSSEAILIEGDTEEGVESEEARRKREDAFPLKVSYERNQISVRARKQPLSVVLYKIANELGVPFELRYESAEVVDIEFKNYPVDQALRTLSPSVRLFYRADLQTFEIQPLRIALVAPAQVKS